MQLSLDSILEKKALPLNSEKSSYTSPCFYSPRAWRSSLPIKMNFSLSERCNGKGVVLQQIFKAVYTTEKLGTDPTRKEYGPHIFARVNFADHVFWHGYGPVFFSVLGP